MRIVVYGAAGRIGMALVRHLSSEHDVRGVDLLAPESASDGFVVGDVRDPGLFRATLTGADASVYLPFAHYDLGIDACNATSTASFDINLRGLFYFLAAAREHGVQRLVFTSSLEVFGGTWEHDTLDETTPTTPRNVYGLTKTLAEETCRFFARRHAMNVVVLRLCGVLTAELWMNHGP